MDCDRISRAQRVDIFGLSYRTKAKSPHPNQVVKTPLHTFQKHNLFELDGHAGSSRPLRRLATNAAINAPSVPKAPWWPHFQRLPSRKATWKAAGSGVQAVSWQRPLIPDSARKERRQPPSLRTPRLHRRPTRNPAYPWSSGRRYVEVNRRRPHRASGGKILLQATDRKSKGECTL
jgi:hypothetical protein